MERGSTADIQCYSASDCTPPNVCCGLTTFFDAGGKTVTNFVARCGQNCEVLPDSIPLCDPCSPSPCPSKMTCEENHCGDIPFYQCVSTPSQITCPVSP
jgi:hypothetical protein